MYVCIYIYIYQRRNTANVSTMRFTTKIFQGFLFWTAPWFGKT